MYFNNFRKWIFSRGIQQGQIRTGNEYYLNSNALPLAVDLSTHFGRKCKGKLDIKNAD